LLFYISRTEFGLIAVSRITKAIRGEVFRICYANPVRAGRFATTVVMSAIAIAACGSTQHALYPAEWPTVSSLTGNCSDFAGSYIDRGYAASTNPDLFGASIADARFEERVDIRYFTGKSAITGPTDGLLIIVQADQSNFVIQTSSNESETPLRQYVVTALFDEGILVLDEVSGPVGGGALGKSHLRSKVRMASDRSLILEQEYEVKQMDLFWYQDYRLFYLYRFLPRAANSR
jgi:hypothetical protein